MLCVDARGHESVSAAGDGSDGWSLHQEQEVHIKAWVHVRT